MVSGCEGKRGLGIDTQPFVPLRDMGMAEDAFCLFATEILDNLSVASLRVLVTCNRSLPMACLLIVLPSDARCCWLLALLDMPQL